MHGALGARPSPSGPFSRDDCRRRVVGGHEPANPAGRIRREPGGPGVMMPTENYDRLTYLGLLLTVAIALLVGLYWGSEPARMEATAQERRLARAERGSGLYEANCAACHGPNGGGGSGPAPTPNGRAL